VDISGPFKYLVENYTIKAEDRKPIYAGRQIKPAMATASSSEENSSTSAIINGNGIGDTDGDKIAEQSTNPEYMWLSAKGQSSGEVEFDFDNVYKLEMIKVYNYNEHLYTGRGVKKADISVWTPATGWKKILTDYEIEQAEGRDDYDEPTVVRLEPIEAQKIRFDNLVNYGDAEYVGLSEVQFFEVRGPTAANPSPADKSSSSEKVTLSWVPGVNATAHNLYFGYDANEMKLLGKLKGEGNCTAKLTPVDKDAKCHWRVDEIRADGSVAKGDIWSFTTGTMKGWWKLDETEGTLAKDSGATNNGIVKGGAGWKPSEGKVGGAIDFDGNDGYVELPKEVSSSGGPITITVWAYPTNAQNWGRFVELGNGMYGDNIIFARSGETNDLIFEVYRNTESGENTRGRLIAASSIELDKWQFFAATVDNEGNATIYKDGKQIQTGKVLVPRDVTREQNYIGKSQWEGDEYYKGMMDDVRIYKCALDESEIKDIYSGKEKAITKSGKLPSIIAEAGIDTEGGKGKNLIWILIIIVAAAAIAAIAGRKKKTVT